MGLPVGVDFLSEHLLVKQRFPFRDALLHLLPVCVGLDVRRVNENLRRVNKPVLVTFLKDPLKYLLKEVRVLKAAGVVFPEGCEVGDGIKHVQAQKPPVRHIHFDFLNGLSHAPDSVQVLYEGDFYQHDGIHAGTALVRRILFRHEVIDEVPVDRLVYFS